jgi:hypothetical protein
MTEHEDGTQEQNPADMWAGFTFTGDLTVEKANPEATEDEEEGDQ